MASEIGVQTIQHTNGTDALTIDSSGIVDMPNTKIYAIFRNTTNLTANGTITAWEVPDTGITAVNIGETFTHSSGVGPAPALVFTDLIGNAGMRNTSGDSVTAAIIESTSDSGSNYVLIALRWSTNNEDGNLYLEVLLNITHNNPKNRMSASSMGASSIYVTLTTTEPQSRLSGWHQRNHRIKYDRNHQSRHHTEQRRDHWPDD